MKQNKKYIICGSASLFVMLLGITSLKSGNVFDSGAFPFLILFVLGAWETHVFTRKKDAERSFLRDALPYFLQVLILLPAAVGLGFLFIREIGFFAFIPAISQIICPVLILIIYGLRNLKYRPYIVCGLLMFLLHFGALYLDYTALTSGSGAPFIATLYICVLIAAVELKLYERKQHQIREFMRESVPFLIQMGIILLLDAALFAVLFRKAQETELYPEYTASFNGFLFLVLPILAVLLLTVFITVLLAAVRRKKAERFVLGGMAMAAAHSAALFLTFRLQFIMSYLICFLVVVGIGLWEMALFYRQTASVRIYMHEMVPYLIQTGIVLAVDALYCGIQYLQYLMLQSFISETEESWLDITKTMQDLGIAFGLPVFLGIIPCAVIQLLSVLVMFVVGAGRTMFYHDK